MSSRESRPSNVSALWRGAALALGATLVTGCAPDPVGRLCDLGSTPEPSASVVATGSLDCISRACLKVPLEIEPGELPPGSSYPTGNLGLCTDTCQTDDDCIRVPESPCKSGFTCGYPIQVGPLCCEKLCVCRDYLVAPDDTSLPLACDPDNPANDCCNLPDRREHPEQYPKCGAR